MATIATFSGTPSIAGLLGSVTITGCSPLSPDAQATTPAGVFSSGVPAEFDGPGWNYIFFQTSAPVTVTNWKIWLGEDTQSGNRATAKVQLYGSTNSEQSALALLDTVTLATPYNTNYSSDDISVTSTLSTPTSAQYFKLAVLSHDWGMGGNGSRVFGFQVT